MRKQRNTSLRPQSKMIMFENNPHKLPIYQQIIEIMINNPEDQTQIDQKLEFCYNSQVHSEQYQIIVQILKMNIQYRTQTMINCLLSFFKNTYFYKIQDQEPDMLKYVIKQTCFENLHSGNTLFEYKEVGNKLYYIMKGQVWVFIPAKQKQLLEQQAQEFQINRKSILKIENAQTVQNPQENNGFKDVINRIHIDNIREQFDRKFDLTQENQLAIKLLEKYNNFLLVSTIEEGQTFGELCFRETGFRNATIVCKTDCQFAVLVNSCLKNISKSPQFEYEILYDFLIKNSLFQGCLPQEIKILSYNAKEIKMYKNCQIYKKGDTDQFFYILKNGQINLFEKVDNLKDQKEKIYTSFMNNNITYKIGQSKIDNQFQNKIIANLNEGQCFGEEIFLGKQYLNYAIVQSNEATLIKFSKKDILLNLQNFNFITNINQIYKLKQEYRNEKIIHEKQQKNIKQKSMVNLVQSLPFKLKKKILLTKQQFDFTTLIKDQQSQVQDLQEKQEKYENKIAKKNKFNSIFEVSQACQIIQTQTRNRNSQRNYDLKDIQFQIDKNSKLFNIQISKQRTLTNYIPQQKQNKAQMLIKVQKRNLRAQSSKI